jgi:phosphatidylglycerophosphatase A
MNVNKKDISPDIKKWQKWVLEIIGTSFGLGYVPLMPGTAGALPGVIIFIIIASTTEGNVQSLLLFLALLAICIITILLSPSAEKYWKKKDPGIFVTDEIAGFLGTVLLWRTPSILYTTLWAFIVTRIIDIIKIPPAKQLEKLPSGIGILADDLCSSLYAAGFLYMVGKYFPQYFGL